MKHFLNSHGVREQFRPGALSVRCFILLMDLNKEHLCFDEMDDSIPPEVKTEAGFQIVTLSLMELTDQSESF